MVIRQQFLKPGLSKTKPLGFITVWVTGLYPILANMPVTATAFA